MRPDDHEATRRHRPVTKAKNDQPKELSIFGAMVDRGRDDVEHAQHQRTHDCPDGDGPVVIMCAIVEEIEVRSCRT